MARALSLPLGSTILVAGERATRVGASLSFGKTRTLCRVVGQLAELAPATQDRLDEALVHTAAAMHRDPHSPAILNEALLRDALQPAGLALAEFRIALTFETRRIRGTRVTLGSAAGVSVPEVRVLGPSFEQEFGERRHTRQHLTLHIDQVLPAQARATTLEE